MNTADQEVEVKFFLRQPHNLEDRLLQLGAEKVQERVHEVNLRFDLPDGSLSTDRRVLRLRRDTRAVLTYKGPSALGQQVNIRQEIETEVSDLGAARRILEALGYQVAISYEKWRTTYRLANLEVVLDEMPYGHFCEIEGPDGESIQAAATQLNLDWNARIMDSYLGLFWRVKAARGLSARNLDFDSFAGLEISPEDLGTVYADH